MADQDDVAAAGEVVLGLPVHLADQRAGGVEVEQLAARGLLRHRLRHAMGGEHHRRIVRDLVEFLDEDRALLLQAFDHEAVVHDLVADVDRRAVAADGLLDDLDRAVDPGAEATRPGEQDVEAGLLARGGCDALVHGSGFLAGPGLWRPRVAVAKGCSDLGPMG